MNKDIETIKEAIRDLDIHKQTEEQASLYLELAYYEENLLKQVYQKNGKKLEFPIDIEMVSRYMGIAIVRRRILASAANQFNKVLGQILISEKEKIIEVDNQVSYKTQQYAIAHSVARYLLLGEESLYEHSYAIPLMPSELGEISADIVALFLLLPLNVFKREFKEYLESTKDFPLDVDNWLQYLSDKSQVSLFNLAIGYQQLKQVVCWERLKAFEDVGYDLGRFEDEYEFEDIFA